MNYFALRQRLRYNELIFKLVTFLKPPKSFQMRSPVTKSSDIVVEGFPRSSNTFLTVALKALLGEGFSIANHYHSSAQFSLGYKLKKPMVLVVREPLNCLVSNLLYYPSRSRKEVIDDYILFHENLKQYLPNIFVVDFNDVTTNPVGLIAEISDEFDLKIDTASIDSEVFVNSTLGLVREHADRLGEIFNQDMTFSLAIPSEDKRKHKQRLLDEIAADMDLQMKLNYAIKVYRKTISYRNVEA